MQIRQIANQSMLLEQHIYENDGFHKINYKYPSKKIFWFKIGYLLHLIFVDHDLNCFSD